MQTIYSNQILITNLTQPSTMITTLALLMFLLINLASGNTECPMRVFCTHNQTMLELPAVPVPIKLPITSIDYKYQRLEAHDPGNCLARLLLRVNFSSLNSLLSYPWIRNVSFFDCSSVGERHLRNWEQLEDDAQDMLSCPIYFADDYDSLVQLDLLSCTKLFDHVLSIGTLGLSRNSLYLDWERTNLDSRCFQCKTKKKHTTTILLVTAGVIVGSTLLAFVLNGLFQLYRYYRMKSEDNARVQNFLEDYRALQPTRFTYADIKRITHHFKEKLGEGAHGAVFKGKLSNEILVAVKILNSTEGEGNEFINEVGTMGKIHHVNVVRLLGFCADGFHRALVYDFFPNGSLQNFISQSNHKENFLGWEKLQQIALGIAKGIEYLHQGCDHRILHFDINPHNVLLDDNFVPKISDFGLAKVCSKNQSAVSMTVARGTLGYMAPEVFSRNFGNVSYKSDMYSYGMLLLEMVGGRKNMNTSQENIQVLYPDWIHNLLEGGGDIHIPIDEEGNFIIGKKMAIVGLWCIQWHPMHRPSMKTVMQMLEGEVDKLKVPSNPFQSTTSVDTSANVVARRTNFELDVIQEQE